MDSIRAKNVICLDTGIWNTIIIIEITMKLHKKEKDALQQQ